MAKAHVTYVYSRTNVNGYEEIGGILCFVCAVKLANKIDDPAKEKIVLQTTDYENNQCSKCARYLEDEVTI